MKTSAEGLSEEVAANRLIEVGPNVVAANGHRGWPWRLLTATRNPLVILLIVLAGISFATGDARAGTVMALMVPGDVVELSAGDMIPGDVRLIAANDLFISQGTLTGESLPVEKLAARETRTGMAPLEFANICFLGTSVESGAATAVILATGAQTYFGSMTGSKEDECDLILKGYVAFLDPPKDSAAKAISALRNHGVTVKVLDRRQ